MQVYASDNFFRGSKVYFVFGLLAVGASSGFSALTNIPPLAGVLDPSALTAGMAYGGLIWLYEQWGWRWISTLPRLTGTWAGLVASSYDGETRVRCVMRIRQTWTRIAIELETDQSLSHTTMVALYENQTGDNGLKYEYVSEPKNRAVETMHTHRGVCTFSIAPDCRKLSGNYYTGRGRETQGEISLERISAEQLDYIAACEKVQ